jgi:predicted RNA-binding Zn ribbon-like protein
MSPAGARLCVGEGRRRARSGRLYRAIHLHRIPRHLGCSIRVALCDDSIIHATGTGSVHVRMQPNTHSTGTTRSVPCDIFCRADAHFPGEDFKASEAIQNASPIEGEGPLATSKSHPQCDETLTRRVRTNLWRQSVRPSSDPDSGRGIHEHMGTSQVGTVATHPGSARPAALRPILYPGAAGALPICALPTVQRHRNCDREYARNRG